MASRCPGTPLAPSGVERVAVGLGGHEEVSLRPRADDVAVDATLVPVDLVEPELRRPRARAWGCGRDAERRARLAQLGTPSPAWARTLRGEANKTK